MQSDSLPRPAPAQDARDIIQILYDLVDGVSRAASLEAIYEKALVALMSSVMPDRASVLSFDDQGVMRFRAWRGLSEAYRTAVEGHSPWPRDATNPEAVVIPDVFADHTLAAFYPLFRAEGLGALAFIPLVTQGQLLGKFMLYYDKAHDFSTDELQLTQTIAHHVAFGLQRRAREHESSALKNQLAADFTAVMQLHNISQRFLEGGRLNELLTAILAVVIEIIGASRGTIQLRDPKSGTLRIAAHQGFGGEFLEFFAEVDSSSAACGRPLTTGQRVIVEDLERDPIFADATLRGVMCRAGVRSVQSTPLLSRTREVLGVISTHFDTPHHPSERDLKLLDLFARQAVDVLEYDQAARRREGLSVAREAARAEAEAASRAKDDFIAMVSHELRTPLTAMLGWTRMLRAGQLDSKGSAHALEVIERNLRQQTQILTDLLDVSRIVSGKLTLDSQPVELPPIIEMAVDVIRPAAEAKRLTLTTEFDTLTGAVSGDATRLQQIFWNLISNAVKFTPPGGRIDVRLERSNDHARVSVVDTGRGIAPEFLPLLFQRFQQAETGFTRHHGGLGLGLAIVRHLVELHGGQVHAFSAGEGQGAALIVDLPLARSLPAASGSVERVEHRNESPTLAHVRILIVDDHEDTLDFLAVGLAKYGADVKVATSVRAAVDALAHFSPHVLVSDLSMPGEDGFSLIRRLRTEKNAPWLTAIALTAHARAQDREQALAAGFQMYLSKPVEPARLGYVIEALVRGESEGPGGD